MTDAKMPITLEELQELANGEVIDIPGFRPGTVIPVRVTTLDITEVLLNGGDMPNILRSAVKKAFEGESVQENKDKDFTPEDIAKIKPMLDTIAKQCLLEPTFEQFQETRPLGLMQKLAIFKYAMGDVDKLNSFRK